jgi:hypothetical protein
VQAKALSPAELDAMIHDIRAPKLLDWFIVPGDDGGLR